MKRKNTAPPSGKCKKRAIADDEAHANFREGLFDGSVLAHYAHYYAASQPYVPSPRHCAPPPTPAADTSTP